jgi:cardiolipin synthase
MTGNSVQVLIDGPEMFAAIRQSIEAATMSVHVETYIFSDDDLGRDFADLLMRKSRDGVTVRVIYDAMGSVATPSSFFDSMRTAGVEVRQFHPLATSLRKLNNRDHRKIIVVDGRIGYTGGANISGAYSKASISKPGPEKGLTSAWRDTQVEIRGTAVHELQTLFFQAWRRADGTIPDRDDDGYFPALPVEGNDIVAIVVNDSDDNRHRKFYASTLSAIRLANRRVWITQAYFAPTHDMLKALEQASARGVDVRLVVPGFTDSSPILYDSHRTFDRLLSHGIRIFEERDALLHAKTMVVDSVVSTVGSANLDMRSFIHNNEATALIVSQTVGERMEEQFARDESRTHEVTLKEWRSRPWTDRVKEKASGLLHYWL